MGLFISLEGPEGGGKSTQAQLLAEWLRGQGAEVVITREPGGDPLSEGIRALLLNPEIALDLRAELLLFLAVRAQHVAQVIRPAMEKGRIVICDRFSDSTVAYQGYGAGLPLEQVLAMNEFATGGLAPHLTLLLDVDVCEGLRRQGEWTRMELRGTEFHDRVRRGFLELAARHPERMRVIDAGQPLEAVAAAVRAAVAPLLPEGGIGHEAGGHGHPRPG